MPLPAAQACGLTRPPRIPASELRPRGRRHSRARDARAVRHHYDVSNDFFKLFLDSSMTYSCAVFSRGATTLEDAQLTKRELVCTKLGLREGERLLDVGCGWGSFVLHAAARHGVSAVGITLSPDQAELARRRVVKAGLEDRVEIRLATTATCRGAASTSTRSRASAWSSTSAPAKSTSTPRSSPTCSAPAGGCSTTASRVCATATPRRAPSPSATSSPTRPPCTFRASCSHWSAPGVEPTHVEGLRQDYVDTLSEWIARLDANLQEAKRLAGGERVRVWRLYLRAARNGFATGFTSIFQVLGRRA